MRENRSRIAVFALLLSLGFMTGCGDTVTPQQQIDRTSQLIQMGVSSTTAMGLVAVPKQEEAKAVANEIKEVLSKSVLPILNGDEAGLAAGLEKILTLEAFNDPKLAKAKLILETALPLLKSKLPTDLIDKVSKKVNPEALAYVKAFVNGLNDGVTAYLGSARGGIDYQKVREGLSK